MTQIQLTDQQLNRALAELIGYEVVQTHDAKEGGGAPWYQLAGPRFGGRYNREPEYAWRSVPNFCTDPAASLEVEKAAIKANADGYIKNLAEIKSVSVSHIDWSQHSIDGYYLELWEIAELFTASPRERAEAAYITLQGERT